MKLWSHREHGECCYPVAGSGRHTMVCASFALGCYCPEHRHKMEIDWRSKHHNRHVRDDMAFRRSSAT